MRNLFCDCPIRRCDAGGSGIAVESRILFAGWPDRCHVSEVLTLIPRGVERALVSIVFWPRTDCGAAYAEVCALGVSSG